MVPCRFVSIASAPGARPTSTARGAPEPQPVIPQAACVWLAWVPNTVSELRQPVIRAPTLVSSAPLPPTAAVPSRSVAAASVRRVGQMETAQV